MKLRHLVFALFALFGVDDSDAAGTTPPADPAIDPPPETTDLTPKAIPTLPPVNPALDVNAANVGINTDEHTTIVGHDENGDPVTAAQVAAKQEKAGGVPPDAELGENPAVITPPENDAARAPSGSEPVAPGTPPVAE